MRTKQGPHVRLGVDAQRRASPPANGARLLGVRDGDGRIALRDERESLPALEGAPAWFEATDMDDEGF